MKYRPHKRYCKVHEHVFIYGRRLLRTEHITRILITIMAFLYMYLKACNIGKLMESKTGSGALRSLRSIMKNL